MQSATHRDLLHVLGERRDAIARRWRRALAPSGYVPLSSADLLNELAELTDDVIRALVAEPFEPSRARAVGKRLASLGYALPQALAATLDVLGQHLLAGLPASEAATLQSRMAGLYGEVSLGFMQEVRSTILAEQETIRQALLTQREEAERALRESEARFRAIFERAPFGIAVADMQGRILTANPALETIVGYTEAEMQGRVILAELSHPDDAQAGLEAFLSLVSGQRDGYEIEQRFFSKAGREMWVHLGMALVRDAEGRPQFAIGMGDDITARRLAEEQRLQLHREQAARAEAEAARTRLAFLAEASTLLTASLDVETTLQAVVRSVLPALGDWSTLRTVGPDGQLHPVATAHVDPLKELLAREMFQRFPGQMEHPHSPAMAVFRSGQPVLISEVTDDLLRQVSRDDEHLRLWRALAPRSALIVPLLAHGHVLGTLTLIDTAESDRRHGPSELALAEDLGRRAALALENAQLYARAQAAIRTAQEAVRARDEFLSVAAHELKTPVTSLRGFAQLTLRALQEQGPLDQDRLQRALTIVNSQSVKLARLVTQLLDISRIQSGKLALECRDTDVRRLVNDAVHALENQAPQHQFRVRGPAEMRAAVDPLRIEQVVINLLDNAVKYSPEGGPVDVEVIPTPSDRRAVRLSVRDYGVGIPAEHREHIFERFYQVDTSSQAAGMGLGLYISRQIVELHGGEIEAESPADGGTRIVVTLPLQPPESPGG